MNPKKDGISRRSFVKGAAGCAAAIGAAGALGACGTSSTSSSSSSGTTASDTSSSEELTKLTIGYWGGNVCELPMYIADMKGYWKEAGIDADIMLITADVTTLLGNDEIDCFQVTPGNFMSLYNGQNLKIIDTVHVGCWSGVTNDDNINSPADLEGKNVATSSLVAPAVVECQSLCGRAGADPTKINFMEYESSLILKAIEDGDVDAAVGIDSTTYPIVEENDDVHYFFVSAQDLGQYYCCYLGVNSDTLEKDSTVGDKLALGMAKAIDYIIQDPETACNEAMEGGYADSTYPDIQRGLAVNYMFHHGNEQDMHDGVKERWQELVDADLIADAPSDETELDSFLEDLCNQVIEWHGDAASDTADTEGIAAHLEERGEAYINE